MTKYPGYEWVFDDPDTIAVEKLDGTNVKLQTENGRLIARDMFDWYYEDKIKILRSS